MHDIWSMSLVRTVNMVNHPKYQVPQYLQVEEVFLDLKLLRNTEKLSPLLQNTVPCSVLAVSVSMSAARELSCWILSSLLISSSQSGPHSDSLVVLLYWCRWPFTKGFWGMKYALSGLSSVHSSVEHWEEL